MTPIILPFEGSRVATQVALSGRSSNFALDGRPHRGDSSQTDTLIVACGTDRTSRADLVTSVVRGRSEVAGRRSERRD